MPNESEELDLEQHLRELGHELCHRDLHVTATTCAGYLFKLCQKSDNNWRKRFFVFDRKSKAFFYFRSRSQQLKQRAPQGQSHVSPAPHRHLSAGGVAFDLIHDIYVDHTRSSDARHVFVVSTSARHYVLAHARPEVMRIWVDALVTGARGQDSDWNWIS